MFKWNNPSEKFTIEELKEKFKADQHRIHTNQVWLCFLRDAFMALLIAIILLLTIGFEELFFGGFNIFFKIMIFFPFTITLCQFFLPQRLVFYKNKILIKKPFRASSFISYDDIEFASVVEERTGRTSMTDREVLVVVTKKCNLEWSEDIANTRDFKAAVKNNSAIIYDINKKVLIDFLLNYRKNFFRANFIDYRYGIDFSSFESVLKGEDISIEKSKIADNTKKQKKKDSLVAESKNASLKRMKEISDELRYIEISQREPIDEDGNLIEFSDEEKKFLTDYRKKECKKLLLIMVISMLAIFFMFILPVIIF